MSAILTAGLFCLATNVYFEARSEDIEGQRAIAEVTLNRVSSDKYPNNICDVVWQRKQFSWTHDGKSDYPRDFEAWLKAIEVAYEVMNRKTKSKLGPKVHHYHSKKVNPSWAKTMKPIAKIGNHIFYSS